MQTLIIVSLALLGLIFGSFLNVVIARVPLRQPLTGRSRCPSCLKTLRAIDLIPLLSLMILKGRCRYCGVSISLRYPAVELLVSVLFVLTYWSVGQDPLRLVVYAIYGMVATVVFFVDFNHRIIPDQVILPAAALTIIVAIFGLDPGGPSPLMSMLAGIFGAGTFLGMHLLTGGEGIGMGDVKLVLFIGLAMGPVKLILAVLLGSLTGILFAASVMILQRSALCLVYKSNEEETETPEQIWGMMIVNGKPALPFGPFLSLGFWIALIWGDLAINTWLDLI